MIRLTLYHKLFSCFGALLCLLGLVGGVGWKNTTEFSSAIHDMHGNTFVPLAELRQVEAALYELRVNGLSYAQGSARERAAIRIDDAGRLSSVHEHMHAYRATDLQPEEADVLPAWQWSLHAYLEARARGMDLYDQGQGAHAAEVLETESSQAFASAHAALTKLIAIQGQQAKQIERQVTDFAQTSSIMLLVAIVLAVTIGLALAIFVPHRIAGLHAASERRRLQAEAMAADLNDLRAHIEALLNSAGEGIYGLDLEGKTTFVNPVAARLLGHEPADLLGTLQHHATHHSRPDGSHYPREECPIYAAITDGSIHHVTDEVFWRADGSSFPVEYTSTPILERGEVVGAVVTFRDVAQRKQVEAALRTSEARLQRESQRLLALHRASTVLAAQTAEPDAVLEEVLRNAVSLIGASSGSLYRWDAEAEVLHCVRNFRMASHHQTSDVRPGLGLAGHTFLKGEPLIVNEYQAWEHAIGPARVGGMRAGLGVPLMRSGKCLGVLILRVYDGEFTQFTEDDARIAVLFADQAAAALFTADAFEQQRRAALHDALTELPNRVLLHDRLQKAIEAAARDARPVALMLMDLDRFKEINDTLGHAAGDVLLQEVARRLSWTLRASDTVARLGGDEFAIVLPGADAETALGAARRLLQVVKQPFVHDEHAIDVGASVGIALHPEHGEDAVTLMRRADVAMYVAKRGNLGAVIYSTQQDRHSVERLALVSDLRRGIERDELVLYFQPKIDFKQCRIAGAEALVRWQHPNSGLMAPDHFIPLAEQSGLIDSLSRWVVESALRQCRAWLNDGIDLPVSVNLSTRNLHDPHLPSLLAQLLDQTRVPPEYLEVEITESAIMADPAGARDVLRELRAMGVKVSADDFGAGHASLTYLKQLPLDALKIDKSFVRELAHNTSDRAIVRSTIELGHELGLMVIAEGVEDESSWHVLASFGCDLAQGYYLSRPLPAREFERWVRHSAWHLTRADRAA